MKETLEAGFAKAAITPKIGVAMAGYMARMEGAQGIHDELYAHAAVLKYGSSQVAIINFDLIEVSAELAEDLREELAELGGIPPDQIMLCATHTHSGPVVSDWFGESPQSETITCIKEGALRAFAGAVAARQRVQARRAQGVVPDIAKNRRTLQETADPMLQVLGFYADSGLIGCFVNFALHATVLGAENLLLSADYPGYLRHHISIRHSDCITLVLNGAAGNVNIGYSADASALGEIISFRTFAKAEQVGHDLASEALDVLENALVMDNTELAAFTTVLRLPLKELPTLRGLDDRIAELRGKMEGLEPENKQIRDLSVKKVYLECISDVIRRFELEDKRELPVKLQVVKIGDVVLVAIPGEPFAEIGLAIKADWIGKQVFIVGYANGSLGYLTTSEAHLEGGYEAETSVFDPDMAEILVAGARDAIIRNC